MDPFGCHLFGSNCCLGSHRHGWDVSELDPDVVNRLRTTRRRKGVGEVLGSDWSTVTLQRQGMPSR